MGPHFLQMRPVTASAAILTVMAKNENRCWPGYTPVPGKKKNEQGTFFFFFIHENDIQGVFVINKMHFECLANELILDLFLLE